MILESRVSLLEDVTPGSSVVDFGKGATDFLEVFGCSFKIFSASLVCAFNTESSAVLYYTDVMVANRNILSLYCVNEWSCGIGH